VRELHGTGGAIGARNVEVATFRIEALLLEGDGAGQRSAGCGGNGEDGGDGQRAEITGSHRIYLQIG
jgi:hypothetical protein